MSYLDIEKRRAANRSNYQRHKEAYLKKAREWKAAHRKPIQHFELQCLQCGNQWSSRVESPLRCPECKRRTWNTLPQEKQTQSPQATPKPQRRSSQREVLLGRIAEGVRLAEVQSKEQKATPSHPKGKQWERYLAGDSWYCPTAPVNEFGYQAHHWEIDQHKVGRCINEGCGAVRQF